MTPGFRQPSCGEGLTLHVFPDLLRSLRWWLEKASAQPEFGGVKVGAADSSVCWFGVDRRGFPFMGSVTFGGLAAWSWGSWDEYVQVARRVGMREEGRMLAEDRAGAAGLAVARQVWGAADFQAALTE